MISKTISFKGNQMSAKISFSQEQNKFIAVVNGKVIGKSANVSYLKAKALDMGYAVQCEDSRIVKFQSPRKPVLDENGNVIENEVAEEISAPKKPEFNINQRFGFIEKLVNMVVSRKSCSAVITGSGGLGKSHTVMAAMENSGLTNVSDLSSVEEGTRILKSKSYVVVKGYSTAKGLYRTLYENNGMVLVFDDCDKVLQNDVAQNLLKGALDSYDKRYISWNADMKDDDLPRSFEFTGAIIFISNMEMDKIDQAIRSRSLCVDVSMTDDEKISRMKVIISQPDYMPEVPMEYKVEALDLINSILPSISNLSLRSLVSTIRIRSQNDADWKDLASYILTQGSIGYE